MLLTMSNQSNKRLDFIKETRHAIEVRLPHQYSFQMEYKGMYV